MLHNGRFVWHDLYTHDPAGSAAFYSRLFGWTAAEAGPNNYRRLTSPHGEFGGLFPWSTEYGEMPTYWTGYVLVADVSETAERAIALGGQAPMEAMPIPGVGTMGIVLDPTGAPITTFTPQEIADGWPLGPGGTGETVLWNELITTDLAASARFHASLFGWEYDQQSVNAGGYVLAWRGGVATAGIFRTDPPPPASAWITYFGVEAIDEKVSLAQTLGATVIHPATDVPGIGRTAWINDPLGATVGLMQPEPGWFDRLPSPRQGEAP